MKCDPFLVAEIGFVENVTEVSESFGSFIQLVTVFRPDSFLLMFFMNLSTVDREAVDSSAS